VRSKSTLNLLLVHHASRDRSVQAFDKPELASPYDVLLKFPALYARTAATRDLPPKEIADRASGQDVTSAELGYAYLFIWVFGESSG
jgi:hypothetical protein